MAGALVRSFDGHTLWVNSVALSADGRHALSGSDDKTLRLWEVDAGKELDSFTADGPVHGVAFGHDGRRLSAGDALGRVHLSSFVFDAGRPSYPAELPVRTASGRLWFCHPSGAMSRQWRCRLAPAAGFVAIRFSLPAEAAAARTQQPALAL